jgi:hypothetical protein
MSSEVEKSKSQRVKMRTGESFVGGLIYEAVLASASAFLAESLG